ncbi:hypothetical protein PISMIDRAFT_682819 [Pisolithus microcarpus 441]|uniref:WD40 repeat-like protein n=1 Tax=Pisolithus microcarpus 441 TaxID=765257 RepID=A0A0C9Y4W8_9AGAM|nr:hypothetical protein PISMIDRAFT_682819 [Pisolithus microcarpus 441]
MESERVLFWLEVLSLIGALGGADSSLTSLVRWLEGHVGYETISVLAIDGLRLVQNFFIAITCSTPHLYLSALPLSPHSSFLGRILVPKFSHLVEVAQGGLKDWPATQLVLQGHTFHVTSVAFSPDGNRIVTGSLDKTVRVWDAKSGDQIGSPLEGHTGHVTSVAFSPDGNRIVSGSWDDTVRVWNAKSGDQIGSSLKGHTKGVTSAVTSVAFSPDGNRIVSGSWDETVRVWDAKSGDQIGSPLKGHTSWVSSVAFSPDGNRIVSGSLDFTVRVWDAKGGDQIGSPLKGHTSHVTSVELSLDGTSVISASGISVPTLTTLHPIHNAVDQVHVNKAICFSSVPSHALSHSDELLDDLDSQVNTQSVQLHPDGWLKGPKGQLLLWIPTFFQKPFYSMYTSLIIPRGCMELNLSKMVHGSKWQECFKQIA